MKNKEENGGGSHRYNFDDSLKTSVSWLVTNVDLSQILDFLVPLRYPVDFLPTTARGWMELIYLSTFVYY